MAGQLEQLLTCCICLDRFRNPKLLPCQHSVCMEPCMEGLVDYVRRQVKCPECRAEHRIPYNGVQGFPANVTLQRFLEAHIEITGEIPDPHTGQIMERCNVCNEKNYLSVCAHCEKKICEDCKSAHGDILKREIGRINNQVKRAVHRLTDQLRIVERNLTSLKQNSDNVTEEIDQITKRLQKAIRDRCDSLKSEIDNYYQTEHRNLTNLKSGLEQEISNVNSNVELAEKHMDDNTPWDDGELMDCKDIFIKTMDFIRAFDYEPGVEYSRRAKFNMPEEINRLASSLSSLGELKIEPSRQPGLDSFSASSSLQGGLMKSKSDHRLAVAFRDQEESGYGHSGRTSPVSRRRFGERPPIVEPDSSSYDSPSETGGRRRFKSRFIHHDSDEKSVNFKDEEPVRTRPRIIDTEDVSRGPLSGITRMFDSPRVIKRLQERDMNAKKKKDEPPKPAPVAQVSKTPVSFGTPPKKTARQISEDEIDKIKKQNKSDATTSSPSAASGTTRPPLERLTSLKDEGRSGRSDRGSVSPRSSTHSPSKYEDGSRSEYGTTQSPSRKTSVDTSSALNRTSFPYSRSSSTSSVGDAAKTSTKSSAASRTLRSDSTDSNHSGNGSISPKKSSGAAFSADEIKNKFQKSNGTTSSLLRNDPSSSRGTGSGSGSSRYHQSRFLGRAGTPSVDLSKELASEEVEEEEEEDTSEDSDSDESEESSEEEEEEEKDSKIHSSRVDTGILLGRSTQSRDTGGGKSLVNGHSYGSNSASNDSGYSSRYGSSTNNDSGNSRYGTSTTSGNSGSSYRRPSYLDTPTKAKEKEDDHDSKYSFTSRYARDKNPPTAAEEETKSPFQSRFLNKSKSSALLGPDSAVVLNDEDSSTPAPGSSRARFEELKKQRLARSKSSAGVDEDDAPTSPTDTSSVGSAASRYGTRYGNDNAANSTSSSASRTTGTTSNSTAAAADDGNGAQLSNWARYLKNKYGTSRSTTASIPEQNGISSSTTRPTTTSSILGKSSVSSLGSSTSGSASSPRQSALSRSRSSHLLGLAKDDEKSEDDSKNVHATPISPAAVDTQVPPIIPPIGNIHRNQYLQKQLLLLKIGSRGSEPGCFTWPRGIAVGPDSSIVVADSSNHRVQVFDDQGNYLKDFGSYGNGEGEFDCLAGVTVNRIGQYIIADRYNHRVQIFDPSGMFLRSFGSQGSSDGKFSYPWGVTTDSLGYIYVCDKENHRIQVFQADGTFVGKFGTYGTGQGQLQHPHYIAVSSTNRVIVSDSNNHRVQIFDVNGKFISSFGGEGCDEGLFKYPRGVAVDEQGYIFLADSGNNRIQIFQSDGTFLRAFGCWGSESGEFKGLEGVAVMSNGNILVCDRENHRIQMF